MKQYRKKPVTIEAVQFDGLNPTEIKDFVGKNCEVEIYDNEVTPPVARIIIHTLEGDMEVSRGDYIIKGVKGEFYPCKPDIFEQTYESAETQKEVDLEEEMEKFGECWPYPASFDGYDKDWVDELAEECAKHFYELGKKAMREQMLKEAVEGEVVVPIYEGNDVWSTEIKIPGRYEIDDKVRIVVLKEEE